MAASHSQFQRLQLSVPAGNTSECVGFSNAFVLTFLAANAEAVVRERIVELFDGRRHATKFADRWPSRPSSVALTHLLDGMAVPIAYRNGARFGELSRPTFRRTRGYGFRSSGRQSAKSACIRDMGLVIASSPVKTARTMPVMVMRPLEFRRMFEASAVGKPSALRRRG